MPVFTAQSEIHCRQFPSQKVHTSFNWDMVDFTMLETFHEKMASEIAINGTAGRCKLKLWSDGEKRIIVNINSNDCNSEMKVIVSIIDRSRNKLHTETVVKKNDDDECTLVMSLLNTWQYYLHDNNLTLSCEFILMKPLTQSQTTLVDVKRISIAHNDNSLTAQFENFFKEKYLADVKIIVGNREFEVHKIVLVGNSPVFETMFTSNMEERREKIVTITDIDTIVFEAFLKYMYTGTINGNEKLVRDLQIVADKYEVLNLKNLCKNYASNNLNSHTMHYCKQFAGKTEYTSFMRDLIDFRQLCEFHEATTAEFTITNTVYKCTLDFKIDDSGRIWLYMHFPTDCHLSMKVVFSIMDASHIKKFTKSCTRMSNMPLIQLPLVSLDDIEGDAYLHDGTLTILCELVYVQLVQEFECTTMNTDELRAENFTNDLLTKLLAYYEDKCFCDITIVVEKIEFRAHRVVLAANSSFFKTMFADNEKDEAESTITISDIDATIFEAFLRFLYTGSIANNEKLVRDLLIVAKNYNVDKLIKLCETYIAKYLAIDAADASLHHCDALLRLPLTSSS